MKWGPLIHVPMSPQLLQPTLVATEADPFDLFDLSKLSHLAAGVMVVGVPRTRRTCQGADAGGSSGTVTGS